MHNVVLGLKLNPYHDTGAAIVADDGTRVQVVAISEERLDRRKNSRAFPAKAIAYCLDTLGCRLTDVRLVVADFIFTEETGHWTVPGTDGRTDPRTIFLRRLEEHGIRTVFAEHHLCHAASAYFATAWEDATAVVIDGLGSDLETQSVFRCEGTRITRLATSRRPGIGWMYSAVTETLLGFDHLQEGKTMGLAGHTRDGEVWKDLFRHAARDPNNPCDLAYPQFAQDSAPGWRLKSPVPGMRARGPGDDPVRAPFVHYAFAAQAELESSVMRLVADAAATGPSRRLCYAGGVALNIPANRLILDSGLFDDLFIQPAASDSGIPLGAALLGYYTMLGGTRRWEMTSPFLGRAYVPGDLDAVVSHWPGERVSSTTTDVARLLANDHLLAWHQGASEYGPRALGHRSILCSPRHPQMKAYLNQEVKHREMFRPFAPLVPVERQHEFFDLSVPSPFMLLNARVHPEKAALMPAVVHADGTARVQTICRDEQPNLHAVLLEVGRLTGVPVLVNTSLNLAGEPIVETPADVVSLFERSRLDALVIEGHLLTKAPLNRMLEQRNPGLDAMLPAMASDLNGSRREPLRVPTVIDFAARERLRTALSALSASSVVVWGNGSHTRELMRVLDRLGAPVRCIVDSRATAESVSPEQVPVMPGRLFTPTRSDLLVLSSAVFEQEMWSDLAPLRARSVHVLALHHGDLITDALQQLLEARSEERELASALNDQSL